MIKSKISANVQEKLKEEGLSPLITNVLWKSLAVHINSSSGNKVLEGELVSMLVNHKTKIINKLESNIRQAEQKVFLKDIANQYFNLSDNKENINTDLPRSTSNRDQWQRCMDRLARLLALGADYSPCVAVLFDPTKRLFYMACNTPIVKVREESKNDTAAYQDKCDQIQELLLSKLAIIKKVVLKKMLIEDALKVLTNNGNHHTYGAQKTKDKRKYIDSADRLRADLEKLIELFEKNPSMSDSFLNSTPTIFIPNQNMNSTSEHAEQVLAMAKKWESGSAIGVNYLCCATCAEEITPKNELQVRGTHGVRFPRVVRSVSGEQIDDTGSVTLSKDLEATDSESESERYKERKMQNMIKKEKFRPTKLHLPVSSENILMSPSSYSSAKSVVNPSSFFLFPASAMSKTSEQLSPAMILLDELIESLKIQLGSQPGNDTEYNTNNHDISSPKIKKY